MTAITLDTYPVDRFSLSYAALAAIVIESLLFAMLVYALAHRTVVTPGTHPAKIVLSFPVVSKPAPPKPKPRIKKQVVKPHPKPVHHVVHQRHIPKPPPPKPVTKPTPTPPKAVTVPQPPPRPSVSPDAMSLFEQQVHESIQSALVYPYAAKMAHIAGRVQVSFYYRAGLISNVKVIQGSPYAMLNAAAIQAVRNANFPAPPANLGDRELQFEIWVNFKQVSDYAQ